MEPKNEEPKFILRCENCGHDTSMEKVYAPIICLNCGGKSTGLLIRDKKSCDPEDPTKDFAKVMWTTSDNLRVQPRYRKTWVKKTVCYTCKQPVVYILKPDGKTVDRDCHCDGSSRPLEAVTKTPDEFYEIDSGEE